MAVELNKKQVILCLVVFIGIGLRMWVMSIGSGFDFESYCIVGEIVNNGRNVYEETTRYNYGPLFFIFQGLCYKLAHILSSDFILTYRILIVLLLTLADLGIMFFIMEKCSFNAGLAFFVNPVSIIISGFHNQFDNIAVLLILYSCFFYNEENKITKKDWQFVFFVALSLITKHILFAIPFWIFVRKKPSIEKRFFLSFFPLFIFIISFIPFILGNLEAMKGVLYNVFLYRSSAFGMFIDYVAKWIGVPDKYYFLIFVGIMLIMGFIMRYQAYDFQLLIYLLAQVIFASASAPQYLVIPLVAVFILGNKLFRYGYVLIAGIYLAFLELVPNKSTDKIGLFWIKYGYVLASLILLVILIYELVGNKIYGKKSIKNNSNI